MELLEEQCALIEQPQKLIKPSTRPPRASSYIPSNHDQLLDESGGYEATGSRNPDGGNPGACAGAIILWIILGILAVAAVVVGLCVAFLPLLTSSVLHRVFEPGTDNPRSSLQDEEMQEAAASTHAIHRDDWLARCFSAEAAAALRETG
ncbi:hypothetical protein B0H66DRAFT_531239 [Apodospora peruviana]|uniref:Uncharacterized protein n=1 Tax=Apodospora peruviana TaxID=516989 RepID=A0AAE0IBC9_9PEZI|nr:hypothetical protein B0H66DRAFT_531239 [Apodospora peruviana]